VKRTMVGDWDIHFGGVHELFDGGMKMSKKDEKELNKSYQAKDDGGPTEEFFHEVFSQIGSLKVNGISLFEQTSGGYLPVSDDVLKYKAEKSSEGTLEKIKAYYRAFGRMVAHRLLLSQTIESNCIPSLYQKYLFKGLSPKDKEYKELSLFQDVCQCLNIDPPKKETVYQRLAFGETNSHNIATVREKAYDLFIRQRQHIVLDSLKEGVSLNGEIEWSAYMWFPLEAVRKMFFTRQRITVEDLMEVLQFTDEDLTDGVDYDMIEECTRKRKAFSETVTLFQTALPEFFERKAAKDENFLNQFVHLCTGKPFLPYREAHPNYKICFEFNVSEYVECEGNYPPTVHTCDKTIRIPVGCYNNNMEVFEERLDYTMQTTAGIFDME